MIAQITAEISQAITPIMTALNLQPAHLVLLALVIGTMAPAILAVFNNDNDR